MNENRCTACDETIPEGRQICLRCEECITCPWMNPKACGVCKADKERKRLDKDRQMGE